MITDDAFARTTWRKAARSQGQNGCVELGHGHQVVGIRDTKEHHLGPSRTTVALTATAFAAFLAAAKSGQFDL